MWGKLDFLGYEGTFYTESNRWTQIMIDSWNWSFSA